MYATSNYTGAGEWLSIDVSKDITDMRASKNVTSDDMIIEFISDGSTKHNFVIEDPDKEEYDIPLLYYKGYSAYITTPSGEIISLPIRKAKNGAITLVNEDGNVGRVTIEYSGTLIQKIANCITILTGFIILAVWIKSLKRVKNAKAKELR